MSLTIRFRRAFAAFRADPVNPYMTSPMYLPSGDGQRHITAIGGGGSAGGTITVKGGFGVGGSDPGWTVHTPYHRSCLINGRRLHWYRNARGQECAQDSNGAIYRGAKLRKLFDSLGIEGRW